MSNPKDYAPKWIVWRAGAASPVECESDRQAKEQAEALAAKHGGTYFWFRVAGFARQSLSVESGEIGHG